MCLSTVYRMHDGEKQLVCKNVAAVRQQEGALVFTDIMGVQTRVEAVLDRMDLMENFIFIKDAKARIGIGPRSARQCVFCRAL